MCFGKDWAWKIGSFREREENQEFQSQRQKEAWSGQGLDEHSQQQLRSNSYLALQLTYVKTWTCCLH